MEEDIHPNKACEKKSVTKWKYPKVCVNLQTDVRLHYSVWRFLLWQKVENIQANRIFHMDG